MKSLPSFHRKALEPVEWRRDEQEIFMEHVKCAVRGERYGYNNLKEGTPDYESCTISY